MGGRTQDILSDVFQGCRIDLRMAYNDEQNYLTSADVDDESTGNRRHVYPSVEGGAFYLEDGVRRSLEELF